MFIEHIIAFIAPHHCLGCGVEGYVLCSDCSRGLPIVPPRCYRCRTPSVNFATCNNCRKKSPLRAVYVRTSYSRLAKEVLHDYKYERAKAGWRDIVEAMRGLDEYMSHNNVLIVPIPTATARVRVRGYDHALLITRGFARAVDVNTAPLLRRIGKVRQVGASKEQRRNQLAGAFWVKPGVDLSAYDEVVLLDDVVTTGATLEHAARTLKKAGAKSVSAVVFAQA